jgi:type I restriction-modification system DNA methylase subunit
MKNLVKQTLERDFDLPQYTDFVKNLFNEIRIQPQEIKVPDSSREFIKKIIFLSDFSDTQKKTIDIYAVELAGGTKVERARSFQRNLISKLLKDNTKDAGLVAFYSKDNPDWRLSFVKLDYKLTDKGVKVEVGTPPKRYSFLVGEAEPSHTAQKQLLPILEDHKNNPLLSDLEDAFSVERVTKEFYGRYRKLFEDLSGDLKKNKAFQIIAEKENIDIDNFAKKLLGQIVFLYFLQKKGWLGVPQDKTWGQGDRFFLRTLFNKAKSQKKDFYNDFLEILFYDTLNNPRRDEVDPAYSRYFDCKIPFLNGGLFEPDYDWKNTLVSLGNGIFEEIIDTFDLYNFTVKEDEPLEKEVAVDPEMLGKVFENLLSENMRKGQGAYYTPREIVHYMCQESLINYLNTETKIDAERIRKLIAFKYEDLVNGEGSHKKTLGFSNDEAHNLDRALANIKVCDPACGSGAFLVGMLNEIVSARRILEPRSEYKLKKEVIQECIYGVDIDPGAVDIAKLRLWLSLVVDFELRDIEPLPNLDYKIMCGNSLLEELIVGDGSIKLFDDRLLNLKELKNNPLPDAKKEELKKQLQKKQKELRDLNDSNELSIAKIKELDSQILAINKELAPKAKKMKLEAHHPVFFAEQADEYFNQLRELHKQFFTEYDPINKKKRRKQIEDIELEFIKSSIKEKVDELASKVKNLNMQVPGDRKKQATLMTNKLEYLAIPEQIHNSKTRPYFLWKLNFFEVFQEKGGFDVVIANPPYITTKHGKINHHLKIAYSRIFESAYDKLDLYILFIEKGIKIAKIGGQITYITPWNFLGNFYSFKIRKFILDNVKIKLFNKLPPNVFDSAIVDNIISIFERETDSGGNRIIFDDMFNMNNRKYVYQGKYSINDKYVFTFPSDNTAEGIFKKMKSGSIELGKIALNYIGIMTGGQKEMISDKPIFKNSKPVLSGKDIDKWIYYDKGKYVNFDKSKIHSNDNEDVYLAQKKILLRKTGTELTACLDSEQFYTIQSLYNIVIKNKEYQEEYILALLNSKLYTYIYNKFLITNPKVFPYIKRRHLDLFPIKLLSLNNQKSFIEVVNKIHTLVKCENYLEDKIKQSKVEEYGHQIDLMVYKLYGLSPDEINIVEKFNHGK